MALIDKIAPDADGDILVSAHEFSAAMVLRGLNEISRQNVIDAFSLEVSDEAQLDELEAYYTGLSSTNKAAFHGRLEACNIALQGGYITKAKYKTMLGMT